MQIVYGPLLLFLLFLLLNMSPVRTKPETALRTDLVPDLDVEFDLLDGQRLAAKTLCTNQTI